MDGFHAVIFLSISPILQYSSVLYSDTPVLRYSNVGILLHRVKDRNG